MIRDANELTNGQELAAELCIVGAGAAGISMALQLANTGIDVLLLESGGMAEERDTQALYVGTVADSKLHSLPDRYRQRRFGGTTTIWGGRCVPFDAIDFEPRDYVAHSGWPFKRRVLEPFYRMANRLCEAGEFSYRAEEALRGGGREMLTGFCSEHFTSDSLERFSCPTDFGKRYEHKLRSAPNIAVWLHANATHIQLAPDGQRVESLSVRTLAGRCVLARARQYVIATGGLETPRLLLASRDVSAAGIGNAHDIVGRFYMCHLAGTIGSIKIEAPITAVHHGYELSDEGVYCRRRLALRADVQRSQRIGNFVARLHHPRITDPAHRNAILSMLFLAKPLISYEYGKRLHGDEDFDIRAWLQHCRNVLTGTPDVVRFVWHMLRDRLLAERKFPSIIIESKAGLYSLDFHAEQQPCPESRVTLSNAQDSLGMPRIHIDWRYTPSDVATVQQALVLLATDLRSSGAARFDYDAASVEAEMTRYGAYGGHHIGTARMGVDPRTSVVDSNCRVHGIDNLFLSGAATFPTSSQANPTLTVVAMALRLADHLRARRGATARASGEPPVVTTTTEDGGSRTASPHCSHYVKS